MTIVLDARAATDHFPGIGRYVISLANTFARIAPDLDLVLLHDPSAISTRLALPDLPRLACPVSPFSIQQQWIVPRHLRRAKATVYHSPYYLMPYRPGVPAILTCYDFIPLLCPEYFTATQRTIYWLAHTLALQAAPTILAISQATKGDLIRFFRAGPQRIVVISLAADAHFYPQPPDRIAAVRGRYGLPEQYVLYLGSNKPHKNLGRLVEAWKISNLEYQVSDLKLVIAGHWDARYSVAKEYTEKSGLQDQVIFVGAVDEVDLPALYSGAALFVFPSLYEGFGLPVLEAMACGTPVVCSSTSSLPEVAGDAALLVNPLDVEGLAQAIGRLWGDEGLREDMRAKGLAQVTRFSWERTAQETLQVYSKMGRSPCGSG